MSRPTQQRAKAGRPGSTRAAPDKAALNRSPGVEPRASEVPRWLGWGAVVVATLVVVWQVRLNLVFANTTPTGVDLGGHVWGPAQWSAHIFPNISGWSPEWFAGLPAYVFYMPFPAVIVTAFDTFLPYGVALKLVVVLGALALPWSAWFLALRSSMSRLAGACMAIMTLGFLFDDSWWRYGGNLRSTVAGEFSYSIALTSCILALACFDRVLRRGPGRIPAACFTAVTLLSHPVISLALGAGVAVLAALHTAWLDRGAWRRIAVPIVIAAAIGAAWWVPFVWYSGELNSTGNPRDTAWAQLFFPLPVWAELAVIALACFGIVAGVQRRHPMIVTLTALTLLSALSVLALPAGILENGRLLPLWHLGRWLLAGIGLAHAIEQFSASRPILRIAIPTATAAFLVLCVGVTTGSLPGTTTTYVKTPTGLVSKSSWLGLPGVVTNIVPLWVKDAFNGYERQPLWFEYHGLMQTLTKVGGEQGCGRALTEDDPRGVYGSRYEFALLPFWTNGCIQSFRGIPEELSRTQPFVTATTEAVTAIGSTTPANQSAPSFDFDRGVRMMRDLGVRYYLAYSEAAVAAADRSTGLRKITTSGPWHVYAVRDASLVVALDRTPRIDHAAGQDRASWSKAAIPAFTDGSDTTIVSDGPRTWSSPGSPQPQVTVSNLHVDRNTISFHVDRTGVPVLVRSSWFPWWQAKGASGPWRAVPNFMVVVPTRSDVTLTARPRTLDHLALGIGIAGLTSLLALCTISLRNRYGRKQQTDAASSSPASESPLPA